jgi:hypothetical protein
MTCVNCGAIVNDDSGEMSLKSQRVFRTLKISLLEERKEKCGRKRGQQEVRKGDRKKLGRKTFKRRKNVREHNKNVWMSPGKKLKWG